MANAFAGGARLPRILRFERIRSRPRACAPAGNPFKTGRHRQARNPRDKNIAKLLGGLVEEIPEGRQILVLADFLEGGDFLGELVGVVLGRLD